jgi:hypothetical protein
MTMPWLIGLAVLGALGFVAYSTSAGSKVSGRITTSVALGGPAAIATLDRGDFVQVLPPQSPGVLVSFAPSQSLIDAATKLGLTFQGGVQTLSPGQQLVLSVPTLLPAGAYNYNILWRDPNGAPQATVLTLIAK